MPIEETVGHFRILSPIARGGMGRVYLARHMNEGQLAAIKVLPDHFLDDRKRSRYLEREVRIAKQLSHENVINIYGLHLQNGIGYLLMEYMDGGNLRQFMKDRDLDLYGILDIVFKICHGLHYIHHHHFGGGRFHSIIHRDIKPENILLSKDGRLKVADFGLSVSDDFFTFRGSRSRAGTPLYMSPEQIRGKPVDIRTDIYSLGLVLYELLTQQLPYKTQDKKSYMKMVISKGVKPVPPSYINKKVPRQLDDVTLKALEKDAGKRYRTVTEMILDLQRVPLAFKNVFDSVEEAGRASVTGAPSGGTGGKSNPVEPSGPQNNAPDETV